MKLLEGATNRYQDVVGLRLNQISLHPQFSALIHPKDYQKSIEIG